MRGCVFAVHAVRGGSQFPNRLPKKKAACSKVADIPPIFEQGQHARARMGCMPNGRPTRDRAAALTAAATRARGTPAAAPAPQPPARGRAHSRSGPWYGARRTSGAIRRRRPDPPARPRRARRCGVPPPDGAPRRAARGRRSPVFTHAAAVKRRRPHRRPARVVAQLTPGIGGSDSAEERPLPAAAPGGECWW